MNLTVLVCDCETMVGTSINSQLNLSESTSPDPKVMS